MDMQAVRFTVVILVIAVLYGSRMVKGKPTETPEGLRFGMKSVVIASRLVALAVYVGFYVYTARTHPIPVWVPVLLVLAVLFVALQLPGTIVLGPDGLTQRFWLLKTKAIRYDEVMTIQALNAGRAVRVAGDSRVAITHNSNLVGQEEFMAEMARRTGKKVS